MKKSKIKASSEGTSPESGKLAAFSSGAQTVTDVQAWQLATFIPIIKELRARESAWADDDELDGMTAGLVWYMKCAQDIELRRLVIGFPHLLQGFRYDPTASHAERFYFTVRPDLDGDREAAAEFWTIFTTKKALPELGFVKWFTHAAYEMAFRTLEQAS